MQNGKNVVKYVENWIKAKVHDPTLALPHHLSDMHLHVTTPQPDRQPLGLDLININEYAKFHQM